MTRTKLSPKLALLGLASMGVPLADVLVANTMPKGKLLSIEPPKPDPIKALESYAKSMNQAIDVLADARKQSHKAKAESTSLLTRIKSAANTQELQALSDERLKYHKASTKTHRRWVGAIGERYQQLTGGKQ